MDRSGDLNTSSHPAAQLNRLAGCKTLFVLTVLFSVMVVLGGAHAADQTSHLTAVNVSPPAQVLPDTGQNWVSLREGQTLREGDRVRTQEGGSAELGIRGQSYHELANQTELVITTLTVGDTLSGQLADGSSEQSAVDLKLRQGTLRNHVNPDRSLETDYTLRTPNAVAGVRGTTFLCEVIPRQGTRCGVLSGEVDFFDPDNRDQGVELTSNQESIIGKDKQVPSPATALDAESRRTLRSFRQKATDWIKDRSPEPRLSRFSAEQFHAPRTLESKTARDQNLGGYSGLGPTNYVDPSLAEDAVNQLITVRVTHPDFNGRVRINSFFFDQLKPIIRKNGGTITSTADGYKVSF